MNAIEGAQAYWAKAHPTESFWDAFNEALRFHGFAYLGPDAVLIAADEGDAWYVVLAYGNTRRFFEVAPFTRPAIAYQRQAHGLPARRVVVPWERFARHFPTTQNECPRQTGEETQPALEV